MSARQPIRRSASLVRATCYRPQNCPRRPVVYRRYASSSTKQRPPMAKIQRSMGGIFEPFLESATSTTKAKPETPTFKSLAELTLKDVLPPDNQLTLFIQHKEIGLSVEKQKALVAAVLSEKTDGLLELADNKASELSALGNLIVKTTATRESTPVALALYKAAMEAGDDRGAFSYATLLYRYKIDEPRSLSILSDLARKGHPYAQMNLAAMIMRGNSTTQPGQKGSSSAATAAVKLYELASKTIDKAYVELGRMYRFGYGVHQDHQKAFDYFSKGAAKGDPQCNFMLGVYYSSPNNGGAVEEDQAKAFKYFQKAAIRGLPEAQYNVGFRFLKGHGVDRNPYNAAEFLRMAATQGFQLAQLNLAAMYIQGDGVKRDLAEAKTWLEKAAAQGGTMGKDAEKRLAELSGGKSDGGKACQIM